MGNNFPVNSQQATLRNKGDFWGKVWVETVSGKHLPTKHGSGLGVEQNTDISASCVESDGF